MTPANVVVKDWCDFDIGNITLIKGQEISNNTEGVKQWKKSFGYILKGSDNWSLRLSEQGYNIKCMKYVQSCTNEIINW